MLCPVLWQVQSGEWLTFEHLPSCRPTAQKNHASPSHFAKNLRGHLWSRHLQHRIIIQPPTDFFFTKEDRHSDGSGTRNLGFGSAMEKWV